MNKEILTKRCDAEVQNFFKVEFETLLVVILTMLNIDVEFPTGLEDLVLSLPNDSEISEQCENAYSLINSDDIKSNIDDLITAYKNLLKYKESLSFKG